jgi:hypothetical protein
VSASGDTGRKVIALVAAYVAGLTALLLSIAVADSRIGSGIALAWILGVLLYARQELRCPLCGASVLNANVIRGLRWLAGERRCPRCRADWDEAAATLSSSRPAGRDATAGEPEEKGQ